ncbi:unnamed protein product [Urochloa decumbens]|uniref:Uncharacterized protein n=1 Tax=Urochloa decumbens TaxID=240449 RepID=A0ABC8VUZ9_9POAL
MVFRARRLSEPEQAHLVTDPQGHDHRLQTRRVVEVPLVVHPRPIARRLAGGGYELPQRVVLGDARAQRVEARVGDEQRERGGGGRGGVADERVEEVRRLADVHGHGDLAAVGVAGASGGGDGGADGAVVEDVGVDEGDGCLGADVGGVARDAGVVEADDEVVRVDLCAPAGAEEDSAVPHNGAGGEAPRAAELARELAHDSGGDIAAPAAGTAREEEGAEGGAEGGEEGFVAGERVDGDAEAGHGPLPRRGGGVAAVREAEVEKAVVVADAGEGGDRGVGEERGRLGQDLVPAGVGGGEAAEERVGGVCGRAPGEEQVAAEGEGEEREREEEEDRREMAALHLRRWCRRDPAAISRRGGEPVPVPPTR